MNNSQTEVVEESQNISKLYIEMEFLSQTVDTLINMAKEQAEAITSIVKYLDDKKEK